MVEATREYPRIMSLWTSVAILSLYAAPAGQGSLNAAAAPTTMSKKDPAPVSSRAKDWRNGAVVYQVMVDRFAPSTSLERKKKLYPAPKRLRKWSENPTAGTYNQEQGMWSHELDFWGGDLKSLQSKIGHLTDLGVDVLYLQPIFQAFTNHKYDTADYLKVSAEYGTEADLKALISDVHKRKMKIVLDGVFNHLGKTSPMFQAALKNPKDPHRKWFSIDPKYKNGYKGWINIANLPGWNLENPEARGYLWNDKKSVVRHYLQNGTDGWRLDVGFELGQEFLSEIRKVSHETKKASWVVGEISGYPAEWNGAVDGVYNFFPLNLGNDMLQGTLSGGQVGMMLADMVRDGGIEFLLKSWLHLDNHDTPRFASTVPKLEDRQILRAMQFTLPGSPVVYYGTELGIEGTGDPANRAPMPWDKVTKDNVELKLTKELIALRKKHVALRVGDFTTLRSDRLFAYLRTTENLRDTVMVVINPTDQAINEVFPSRLGRLLSWGEMEDVNTKERFRSITGIMRISVPAKSVRILTPVTAPVDGYSAYERVK